MYLLRRPILFENALWNSETYQSKRKKIVLWKFFCHTYNSLIILIINKSLFFTNKQDFTYHHEYISLLQKENIGLCVSKFTSIFIL